MKFSFVEPEYKTYKGEIKSYDDNKLILEHFISTETQDDIGDIMRADGMKIRGKPVVLFQHGFDPKFGYEPIAKVLSIEKGYNKNGVKGIIAKTQYYDGSHLNPPDNTGRRLYEKAKEGIAPNFSIGFNILKYVPLPNGRDIQEWELLEYSQVAVPMNPEATFDKQEFIYKCKILKENDPENYGEKLDDIKPYPNDAEAKSHCQEKGGDFEEAEHEKIINAIYSRLKNDKEFIDNIISKCQTSVLSVLNQKQDKAKPLTNEKILSIVNETINNKLKQITGRM